MKIELKRIQVRDLVEGYEDNDELGVRAYDGKLDDDVVRERVGRDPRGCERRSRHERVRHRGAARTQRHLLLRPRGLPGDSAAGGELPDPHRDARRVGEPALVQHQPRVAVPDGRPRRTSVVRRLVEPRHHDGRLAGDDVGHHHRRPFGGEGPGPYTWWTYRGQAYDNDAGWRIDYQLASADLAALAKDATVDRSMAYADRWSDHAPVTVTYDL